MFGKKKETETELTPKEVAPILPKGQSPRKGSPTPKRKQVEAYYIDQMQSFEGTKPPYVAPDVDSVHWMLYTVHLGKRFTASACAQIEAANAT